VQDADHHHAARLDPVEEDMLLDHQRTIAWAEFLARAATGREVAEGQQRAA
jgi:hypothetical protein